MTNWYISRSTSIIFRHLQRRIFSFSTLIGLSLLQSFSYYFGSFIILLFVLFNKIAHTSQGNRPMTYGSSEWLDDL